MEQADLPKTLKNGVGAPILNTVTTCPDIQPASSRAPARWKEWKERGATMVEFAIVAFWLFALIFLVIEGAFAVRARNTMSNAIDDAARRGAVAGASVNADYQVMFQLFGRGANAVADVEYVTVFKALSGSGGPTASCKAGVAETDWCNVYPASILFDGNGAFNANESLFNCSSYGTQWCATGRGASDDALEFIGVYVKADYRPIMDGIVWDFGVNVSGHSLQAIETTGED